MTAARLAVFAAACAACGALRAAPWTGKAKTAAVGDVAVSAPDAGAWTFAVSSARDAMGRETVKIRLSAPAPSAPPKFEVSFGASGRDVLHVWTPMEKNATLWPAAWGLTRHSSQLAYRMPLMVAFDERDEARLAVACSETFRCVKYGLTAWESTCKLEGRFKFFEEAESPISAYETELLFDARGRFWGDAVAAAADWIGRTAKLAPARVPEAAREPLYSTWYAYWQNVHAAELEREAVLAARLGMKAMILDDGWQKEEAKGVADGSFYAYTGDWMPARSRFPDMKAHVAKIHAAGLKYMLWLAVPFMGNRAQNYARFKGKYLRDAPPERGPGTATLDPRFPEVREYLVSTYARVVGEWGFDGVKLDFIDEFRCPANDPAVKENYAGRDYKSVPDAVNRLMKDVLARLVQINPDVLVEFRQWYMGPAIRQYGNMIRAADCPADPASNRRRIADLRLTSGDTAVHADMLVWNRDETAQGAARPIISALFGTIQYSMVLQTLPEAHRAVVRHWIAFARDHRDTLLKGAFRPHHPELGYPWIEAESDAERLAAVYVDNAVVPVPKTDKPFVAVNGSQCDGMVFDFAAAPGSILVFDAAGKQVPAVRVDKGLQRVAVPAAGYAVFSW